MPTKKGASAYKRSERAAWRKVDGEAIILDLETAVYYSLTGAGLRMWELLEPGATLDEVARVLAGEFDASEKALSDGVSDLAGVLCKRSLLEPYDGAGGRDMEPSRGPKKKYRKPELLQHGTLSVVEDPVEDVSE